MTIRQYNQLLELNYLRKRRERLEITPLENTLFLLEQIEINPTYFDDFKTNYNKWFNDSQALFGLYRSLQRGIFCPTSSMMDAMDNCSLKYNSTEPKEVGTSYSEIVYENETTGRKISFGGVVLNYNENVNDDKELTAKIYYDLVCKDADKEPDIATISTLGIKVSESNDLKARVAYKCVIEKIKEIYDFELEQSNVSDETEMVGGSLEKIQTMWKNVQYQVNPINFNNLLSATALKTMGDYLQECQACFKWGGYINTIDKFPDDVKRSTSFKKLKNKLIYRSVSEGGAIIPYDNKGNGLRMGIQGDRPSGFRSIYMLLNGNGAVNDQSITGYMFTSSTQNPSRTLLVSRNIGEVNENGLQGNVIFVTRELQIPEKNELLKSLEYIVVKEKNRKVLGEIVNPEIEDETIYGSELSKYAILNPNPFSKPKPLKNSSYQNWIDYELEFEPEQEATELEFEETDRERELRLKREERHKKNSLSSGEKDLKNKEKAEKAAEKERIKAEKEAEKERMKAQKLDPAFIAAEKERKEEEKRVAQIEALQKKEIAAKKREEAKAKRIEYESSPDFLAEKERLEAERIENDRIAEENRIAEEKQTTITNLNTELSSLLSLDKTNLSISEKKNINKQINSLESQLRQLNKRRGGGKSLKNKSPKLNKYTRKFNKKYNQINKNTKKYNRKYNKNKNTRKYIYN